MAAVTEVHPVDFTNAPELTGLNDKLVAINATLQIDLLGQCGSESLGSVPHSGTGGQSDFVRAANRSRGGKVFIVLPSAAKGDSILRIVPVLSPGHACQHQQERRRLRGVGVRRRSAARQIGASARG